MMSSRQLLLLSSSKVHGHEILAYAADEIKKLLKGKNVLKVLFIPYAIKNHDWYLDTLRPIFQKFGFELESVHTADDPVKAIENAEALYVGGGNTFVLLKTLYDNQLVDVIRKRVLLDGMPYLGSSAGSNVATRSINTTNDMPIVYPPTFTALDLVKFNINPHYLDPDPKSTHKGETREERILQFQELPGASPVVGLREGSFLHVDGDKVVLKGLFRARIFIPGKVPEEAEVSSDLSYLEKL